MATNDTNKEQAEKERAAKEQAAKEQAATRNATRTPAKRQGSTGGEHSEDTRRRIEDKLAEEQEEALDVPNEEKETDAGQAHRQLQEATAQTERQKLIAERAAAQLKAYKEESLVGGISKDNFNQRIAYGAVGFIPEAMAKAQSVPPADIAAEVDAELAGGEPRAPAERKIPEQIRLEIEAGRRAAEKGGATRLGPEPPVMRQPRPER